MNFYQLGFLFHFDHGAALSDNVDMRGANVPHMLALSLQIDDMLTSLAMCC